MAKFRIDSLAALARQMEFAPLEVRAAQAAAAEQLLHTIEPNKAYPTDFVIFKVTGYHPKSAAVEELTGEHERGREAPWHVTDAPSAYIDGQLRGIVGVELAVSKVEGKAKLSQNRSRPDREGVVTGLRQGVRPNELSVADQMASALAEEVDG